GVEDVVLSQPLRGSRPVEPGADDGDLLASTHALTLTMDQRPPGRGSRRGDLSPARHALPRSAGAWRGSSDPPRPAPEPGSRPPPPPPGPRRRPARSAHPRQ